MSGLYAADGSWNVTVVDGSTITGLYAADGSMNVVEVDGTTPVGLHHPCGAFNVKVATIGEFGWYHESGAMLVEESPYTLQCVRVTVVSGAFGGGGATDAVYGLAGTFGSWS